MSNDGPIGVFDSGVGGLTVLKAVRDLLPQESTVYLGDSAYFPYGPKPAEVVRARALVIAEYLLEMQVKAIVVACNTASSAALADVARLAGKVPVIGVIKPGARAAVDRSKTKRIGLVATEGTVRSNAYPAAVLDRCPQASVHSVACGRLVDLIEAGLGESEAVQEVVSQTVEDLVVERGCDTIILGCTHFPLVRWEFEKCAGGAQIVDSASSTAAAVRDVLGSSTAGASSHTFLVTAQAASFVRQARLLFGEHIDASAVEIGTPDVRAGVVAATASAS